MPWNCVGINDIAKGFNGKNYQDSIFVWNSSKVDVFMSLISIYSSNENHNAD